MKKKLGIIFGGMSTENEVSVQSAKSIMRELNKEKYEIFPIYISKEGIWYKYLETEEIIEFGQEIKNKEKIENIIEELKKLDVIFPVLHGLYGEDGTIQGLFELLGVKYVGCKVLASSIGMDKAYTKIIFDRANINQAKYEYIKIDGDNYIYIDKEFNEEKLTMDSLIKRITTNLEFPVFVKPSNSGSSVGINKAENEE